MLETSVAEAGRRHPQARRSAASRRHGWPESARRPPRQLIAWTLVLVGQRAVPRSGARAIGAQRSRVRPAPALPDRAVVSPLGFALLLRLMGRALPSGARVLGIFQAAAESIREDQVRPVPQWAGPTAVADASGRLELLRALENEALPPVQFPDVEGLVDAAALRTTDVRAGSSDARTVCVRATIVCLRDGTRVVGAHRAVARTHREEP